jgi:hypothetical protein
MKVYADLEISGEVDALERAITELEASLNNGWSRSLELEGRLRIRRGHKVRCFTCTETNDRRAASVWLTEREGAGLWWVANIVPTAAGRLSHDEYNAIIEEFRSSFLQPIADRMQLAVRMGKTSEDLEDWLTGTGAERLRVFSESANKSTGSSHHDDRHRWFEFLTQVHSDNRGPSASILRDWLIGDEWPDDVASELASEYEFGRGLLQHYDQK